MYSWATWFTHKLAFRVVSTNATCTVGLIYKQRFLFLKSGTTWSFLFWLKGRKRKGFIFSVQSQDLISQASLGACLQRGFCATGPLRYPALCICCRSESVSTACIALFTPPLPSCSLPRSRWGHVLGTRIAGDNAERCLLYTRTHT